MAEQIAENKMEKAEVVLRTPQLDRRIKLLNMFRKGLGQNCTDLSVLFGVKRREIFRDIKELKKRGCPIVYDREEERYRYQEGESDPIDYDDYLAAIAPKKPTLNEALAVLKELNPITLQKLLVSRGLIPPPRPLPEPPSSIMSFSSSEIVFSRQPRSPSPALIDKLSALTTPLMKLNAADRNWVVGLLLR